MNKYSAIIKRVIKSVTPPIILKSLVKLYQMLNSNNISWKGNYPDWQSAQADARGYATDDIFIKTREAARAVRDGKALWERDSVLFYHEEYNFPLVAALMTVAAMNNGRLRVLDYGGSFGSTFYQHKSLFQNIDVSWNIVEQKHIVVSGIEEFKTNQIHFWADIQSCSGKFFDILGGKFCIYCGCSTDPSELVQSGNCNGACSIVKFLCTGKFFDKKYASF